MLVLQIWEGGYREPGIAWWPGKIKAGTHSEAIVATYDIFPTVLSLAGAPPPPPGLFIDGIDLSAVLLRGADEGHKCITFYKYPHAATSAEPINLAAIRYVWLSMGLKFACSCLIVVVIGVVTTKCIGI